MVPEPKNYDLSSLLRSTSRSPLTPFWKQTSCLLRRLSVTPAPLPQPSFTALSHQHLDICRSNHLLFNVPTHTHTNTPSVQALPFLSFPCPARQYQRVTSPHPPPCLTSCPLHLTLVYPIGSLMGALSNIPGDLRGTKLDGPASSL